MLYLDKGKYHKSIRQYILDLIKWNVQTPQTQQLIQFDGTSWTNVDFIDADIISDGMVSNSQFDKLSTAATSASPNSLVLRDGFGGTNFGNLYCENLDQQLYYSQTASNNSITLTKNSSRFIYISSGTNINVTLPDATTINIGTIFEIWNNSSGTTNIYKNGGGLLESYSSKLIKKIICKNNSTAPGDYDIIFTTFFQGGVVGVSGGGTGLSLIPTDGQILIGNSSEQGYNLSTLFSGSGINITNNPGEITISNSGVTQIYGTAHQILVTANSGNITVSTPQDINTTSTPTFEQVVVSRNPTISFELANKQYVDAASSGINTHIPVVVATTSNLSSIYDNGVDGKGATLTNNGTQQSLSIDGYSLSVNESVLVKNQTNKIYNGIYVVTNVGSVSTNWILT